MLEDMATSKSFVVNALHKDDRLETLVHSVAQGLITSSVTVPEGYFRAPASTLIYASTLYPGSLQFNNDLRNEKVFFLKTVSDELENTEVLRSLGVNEAIRYSGSLTIGEDFYLYGRFPGNALNLSRLRIGSIQRGDFFGAADVLQKVASIAARIHTRGYVHGRFTAQNFIHYHESDGSQLALYGNVRLHLASNKEEQEHELDEFVASLENGRAKEYKRELIEKYSRAAVMI